MTWLRALVDWDRTVRVWLTAYHHPIVDWVMVGLSLIGRRGAVWLAIALVLVLLDRGRLRGAFAVVAAIALAYILTDALLKPLIARERPFDTVEVARVLDRRPTTYSFPSGHAASAVAGAWTVGRLWPAGRFLLWTLAMLISVSRVYVGVHYPLDVIVGALVGCVSAGLVLFAATPTKTHNSHLRNSQA
jgi:undecaprenyl-diphosphatase